ncbi:MAG TPA: NAD(P)-binding domain-containing protein [Burkholderiaceae bacterium]|nr:NAD(P)-binding domain-containing protein [Burkholderiaceae bacterium]
MANIAFFGLGAMGCPIALNLVDSGNRLSVFDLSATACERLASVGARIGATPADTVRDSEFIITLLPTSVEVRHALLGPDGALDAAAAGAVFIDMTTGALADFMRLHREISERGMTLIDSPIARGPDFAAARANLFLIGGSAADLERVRPVLGPVCEELVHCGPAGSALKTKIINNYLASVSVVANAEALALASAAGLDREFLRALWKKTVAGRGALETVYPGKAFAGDFTPGFSARLARKDLKLAQELGEQYGVPLATGAAAREMFTLQQTQGRIDDDWTALLDVLERLPSQDNPSGGQK